MTIEREYLHFTQEETQGKVGKRIKTMGRFSGVPEGTSSQVSFVTSSHKLS